MATEKENIIKMIIELPDDVSLDEIMYHLYVRQRILRGLEDAKHGRTYTHDQAKKMAEKWLK
jgi:predicted transcriptional regulator